ncbi:hypothetical protein A3K55_02575 [Candidatus Shapirobacteria bacterium RBG_13_44_7]|uniref:DUF1653 domain-containing protein n=1 Tax=Candidatus Shapirobacteria bacterium RBG_13_44_7 TaxID=1802149 RepID=A0A1F7SJZ7_9BACT|nr:MAG: hypothetical protein A3K55_02575 [Candidatus Shapirobacteria bacterium RBG_13_44_7]
MLSQEALGLKPGKYRHFKGETYEVLGVAVHSETLEELVVYRRPTTENPTGFWVRPLAMFLGNKELPDGTSVPRFVFVK